MTVIHKLLNTSNFKDLKIKDAIHKSMNLNGWDVYLYNMDRIALISQKNILSAQDKSLIKLLELRNKTILSKLEHKMWQIINNRNINLDELELYLYQAKTIIGEDIDISSENVNSAKELSKLYLISTSLLNSIDEQQKTLYSI